MAEAWLPPSRSSGSPWLRVDHRGPVGGVAQEEPGQIPYHRPDRHPRSPSTTSEPSRSGPHHRRYGVGCPSLYPRLDRRGTGPSGCTIGSRPSFRSIASREVIRSVNELTLTGVIPNSDRREMIPSMVEPGRLSTGGNSPGVNGRTGRGGGSHPRPIEDALSTPMGRRPMMGGALSQPVQRDGPTGRITRAAQLAVVRLTAPKDIL